MYQITLMPGPDVLRRGVNPLGVLDELRELGETTIATDPALVPPLGAARPGAVLPDVDDRGEDGRGAGANLRGVFVLCGRQRLEHQPAGA